MYVYIFFNRSFSIICNYYKILNIFPMLYSRSLCFVLSYICVYINPILPVYPLIPFFFFFLMAFNFLVQTNIHQISEARTMEKTSGIAQPCAFYFQSYPTRSHCPTCHGCLISVTVNTHLSSSKELFRLLTHLPASTYAR